MNPDRIHELLRGEPRIEPSLGFAKRVMGAVRRQAAERGGLTFPWRRLTWGLAACAAVTLAALLVERPASSDPLLPPLAALAATRSAIWLAASLLGSWVIVWWSLRVAGCSR